MKKITTIDELKNIFGEKTVERIVQDAIRQWKENKQNVLVRDQDMQEELLESLKLTLQELPRELLSSSTVHENRNRIENAVLERNKQSNFEYKKYSMETIFETIESSIQPLLVDQGVSLSLKSDSIHNMKQLEQEYLVEFDDKTVSDINNLQFSIDLAIENEHEFEKNENATAKFVDFIKWHEGFNEQTFSCGLCWLLYQQGYGVEDLIKQELYSDYYEGEGFLDSVNHEISNIQTDGADSHIQLYASLQVNLDTYIQLVSQNEENIRISKEISDGGYFGLFDSYSGNGSELAIQLEKDVILSRNMIGNILIEGVYDRDEETHTIGDIYGFNNEYTANCWKDSCIKTTVEPALETFEINQESIDRAIQEIEMSRGYSMIMDDYY